MLDSRFLQAHTKDSRGWAVRLESTSGATTSAAVSKASSGAAASSATERHFVGLL
jgi:hypothetical protein